MFRAPVIVVAAKLVIVAELSVVLLETTRALSVVVPAGTLNPPLDTVTLPAVDGLNTMLLLDATKRLPLGFTAMEPKEKGATPVSWVVGIAMKKIPEPPLPPPKPPPPPAPPPPLPLFEVALQPAKPDAPP
jgi:hypothetical protein